jgi:hypothetical protein
MDRIVEKIKENQFDLSVRDVADLSHALLQGQKVGELGLISKCPLSSVTIFIGRTLQRLLVVHFF